MQTTDTSIDLYWKDDMLRSRPGPGDAPPRHIPVADEFADRLARKMSGRPSPGSGTNYSPSMISAPMKAVSSRRAS
jgi:hypothetical protein